MIVDILAADLMQDQVFSVGGSWFTCAEVFATEDGTRVSVYADPYMRGEDAPTVRLHLEPRVRIEVVHQFLRFDNEHGNVFAVLGQVTTALRMAGVPGEMISALRSRVFNMHSYEEVLDLLKRTIIAD